MKFLLNYIMSFGYLQMFNTPKVVIILTLYFIFFKQLITVYILLSIILQNI